MPRRSLGGYEVAPSAAFNLIDAGGTGVRTNEIVPVTGATNTPSEADYATQLRGYAAVSPDLVWVCLGANDYLTDSGGSTPSQVATALSRYVDDLRALPSSPSVMIVLTHTLVGHENSGRLYSQYRSAILGVATAKATGLFDISTIIPTAGTASPLLSSTDNLHFSDAGHQAVSDALRIFLSNLISTRPVWARAWVAAQTRDAATMLAIGDSLTEGQGASTKAKRWIDLLSIAYRAYHGLPTAPTVTVNPVYYRVYGPDSTWVASTARSGTIYNQDYGPSFGRRTVELEAGAEMTFSVYGSVAEVWWSSGYGMTYQVDGGKIMPMPGTSQTTSPPTNRSLIPLGFETTHTLRIINNSTSRYTYLLNILGRTDLVTSQADGGTSTGGSGDMVLATAQTVTGAKTFGAGKLLMTDGTRTVEPYSDVNAPQDLERTVFAGPAGTPATGRTMEWTSDGVSLDMKNAAGVVTRIGPSTPVGGFQPIVAGSSARRHSTANQSLPSGAVTAVALGGTTQNVGSIFDLTVANQIKVTKAGTYLIAAAVFFEFGSSGQRNVIIRKNGTSIISFGTIGTTGRPGGGDAQRLAVGDVIDLAVYIDGGSAAQASLGTDSTYLSVTLLEPEQGTALTAQSINSVALSAVTGYAADTYLVGSGCAVPVTRLKAGSMYRLKFKVTKTAAGVATPIVTVRLGTAGTTADAALTVLTFPAQTAVVDSGFVEVFCTFRTVGSGTTAVLHSVATLGHTLAATGLSTANMGIADTVSSGFNSTTVNTILGVSVNGGTSAAWTISMVQAELFNLV